MVNAELLRWKEDDLNHEATFQKIVADASTEVFENRTNVDTQVITEVDCDYTHDISSFSLFREPINMPPPPIRIVIPLK
jgi:hypothetical protein